MKNLITYTTVSTDDVERVMDKINEATVDEQYGTINMACIALAFLYQDPDISPERLVEGVKGASEWIAMFISEVDEEQAN